MGYHHNGYEDRRWKIQCGSISATAKYSGGETKSKESYQKAHEKKWKTLGEKGTKNDERMSKQKEREKKAQNGQEGRLKAAQKKEKATKKYREVLAKTNTRCSKVHVSVKKSLTAVHTQYGLQVQ